jgi:exodeoxyribonuclease-1
MRTCYALRPEGINWPIDDEGLPSFKLEKLSVANGIEHENAHDAMADVIATIELAKKLKAAQPKLFDYLYSMRHKRKLNELVDIVNLTPLVHVSGMFGVGCSNTSWVVPMGWHPKNQNADNIRERMYTKRDDLNPGELPIPVKLVHLNKCPILAPAKTLTVENAQRIGIDREQCLKNLTRLKQHPEVREKLIDLYSVEREYENSNDVDSQLYDGFFTPSDRAAMDIIQSTHPANLAALDVEFGDQRIAPLLFRYRARNFVETLDEQEQQKWANHCREYFESRLPDYMLNLENLAHEHEDDENKLSILRSVYKYVEQLVS